MDTLIDKDGWQLDMTQFEANSLIKPSLILLALNVNVYRSYEKSSTFLALSISYMSWHMM